MSRHGALRAYGSLYEVECMLKSGYKAQQLIQMTDSFNCETSPNSALPARGGEISPDSDTARAFEGVAVPLFAAISRKRRISGVEPCRLQFDNCVISQNACLKNIRKQIQKYKYPDSAQWWIFPTR